VTPSDLLNQDTFLTALYCLTDDLLKVIHAPTRSRRPPTLTDSEVITLAVLHQWFSPKSERCFIRYARENWHAYFPHLISQSRYNRRVRNLLRPLAQLTITLAEATTRAAATSEPYSQVLDAAAVPLARFRRGARSKLLAGVADVGRGGSSRQWYWGVKFEASVTSAGCIAGFLAGPASTEERWLAECLFQWRKNPSAAIPTAPDLLPTLGPSHRAGGTRKGPTGLLGPNCAAGAVASTVIADLNYRGRAWQEHWWRDLGVLVRTKEGLSREEAGVLSARRQVVESVFSRLTTVFGLHYPRVRTVSGLHARLSAKAAAQNALVHLNTLAGRPTGCTSTPLS